MTLDAAAHRQLQKTAADPVTSKTANWAAQVGVHRVTWHNGGGIGRANLLASGTASGLGRVDVVKGRFAGGTDPGEWLE